MQNIAKAPTTEEVILLHFAISFCCSSRAVGFYVILFCRTSPISRSFFYPFFFLFTYFQTLKKKVPTNQSLPRFYDTNTLYLKGCLFFFRKRYTYLCIRSIFWRHCFFNTILKWYVLLISLKLHRRSSASLLLLFAKRK